MALPDQLPLRIVLRMMVETGVRRCYLKSLAPNDNSKNQPYLGADFGVLNIIPSGKPEATVTRGAAGEPIFKAALNLWWLAADGSLRLAPDAKLILYPGYPEVRLSGYLRGVDASHRPSAALGTTRASGRVLLLGVCDDGRIVGVAAAEGTPLARECLALTDLEEVGVFRCVPVQGIGAGSSSREQLLSALCRVASMGWIDSHRLDSEGRDLPCTAPQCGGYTLEAELGIRPNGRSEPDIHGWELKQIGVSSLDRPPNGVVTLMTPEPTDGVYAREGVIAFLERYGYPDVRGRAHRRNFGGRFLHGRKAALTGLTLWIRGFDPESCRIIDPGGGFFLVDTHDVTAAAWHFADLLNHWSRKHARAAYVSSLKRDLPRRQYRFGRVVRLGEGTSFERFLAAVHRGDIYLDPGVKVEDYPHAPRPKKRNQFRIRASQLASLYGRFETVDCCR